MNVVAITVLGWMLAALPTPIPLDGTPLEIVRAVAARHVHGTTDDLLTPTEMTNAGRVVTSSCGPASVWTVALLIAAGHEARLVTTLILNDWNSFDNGHTMVGVREAAGWVVYDIDRDVYFTDQRGRTLNSAELVARVLQVPGLGDDDRRVEVPVLLARSRQSVFIAQSDEPFGANETAPSPTGVTL